jgi:hypothetical protein
MHSIRISDLHRYTYSPVNGVVPCWMWAVERFGWPGLRWNWDTLNTFYFKDSADAVLFALRWSE